MDRGQAQRPLQAGWALVALQRLHLISQGLATDSASFLWQRQQRGSRSTMSVALSLDSDGWVGSPVIRHHLVRTARFVRRAQAAVMKVTKVIDLPTPFPLEEGKLE